MNSLMSEGTEVQIKELQKFRVEFRFRRERVIKLISENLDYKERE